MTRSSPETDEVILDQLAAREPDGLRHLLTLYGNDALRFLRHRFGAEVDRQLCEEALQLAAIRVWDYAPRLDRSIGRLRGWFVTIVRNCMLGLLSDLERERGHVGSPGS